MKRILATLLVGWILVSSASMAHAALSTAKAAATKDAGLAAIRQTYVQLQQQMRAHPRIAQDTYLTMGMWIIKHFLGQIQTAKQAPAWSALEQAELHRVIKRTKTRLAELEQQKVRPYVFPKPQPPIVIKDGMLWSTGGGHRRPVFLYGYGHFTTVDQDLPIFHKLGVSLVQQDRGPSCLSPDGKFSKAKERHSYGNSIVSELKTAHRSGVMMDLLLSPHYFPAWARKKDPQVTIHRRPWNFITYKIDNPTARFVIHSWLHTIIPMVRNQPALFSVNLANEPAYFMSGLTAQSRPEWIRYLKKKHHTIAALNALYHSHYKSFSQVPPPPHIRPPHVKYDCYLYDWARFNQRHFAAWFQWMNQQVKHMAPNLPTHVKIIRTFNNHNIAVINGINPEMISNITTLAGNDGWTWATPGKWGFDWRDQELWYDMLHSFRGQPVFNSENHMMIPDYSKPVHISPTATRAALWDSALHHLAATTIWVWQKAVQPIFRGDIYMRPANMYAASRAMLDVNRLAPELVKINEAPARVAILYSFPSLFWNAQHGKRFFARYAADVDKAYATLDLTGHQVTFISESQLAHGRRSPANAKVKWIILAGATHVTKGAVAGLKRFVAQGGHLLAIGPNALAFNQYNQRRTLPAALTHIPQLATNTNGEAAARKLDALLAHQGLPTVWLHDPKTGKRVWGVEYRLVHTRQGMLVSLMNLMHHAVSVQLKLSSPCRDLVSGRSVNPQSISLAPMQPYLLRCGAAH